MSRAIATLDDLGRLENMAATEKPPKALPIRFRGCHDKHGNFATRDEIEEAAKRLGCSMKTITNRMRDSGWDKRDALTRQLQQGVKPK